MESGYSRVSFFEFSVSSPKVAAITSWKVVTWIEDLAVKLTLV